MLYDDMLQEQKRLKQEIDYMERRIAALPEGTLICAGTQEEHQFYQSVGATRKYLSKQERHLAEALAEKKYYKARLKDARRQLKGIDAYLKMNNPALDTAPEFLQSSSKCCALLVPLFRPINAELAQWAEKPYPKNKKYPNQLKHDTVNGLKVRSKSESIIAMQLATYRIPFHYEEEQEIGGVRFCPDFTLRHPKTGELFYWEHFGRLDDPAYQKNLCQKLQLYMSDHIFPSVNLIITWESSEKPLTLNEIRYEIKKHFL
ncbi:MAG: hypothetical protein J6L76_08825 [Clostridia bacterium]|nr:hypothetical protein [Clostridia bacterium]